MLQAQDVGRIDSRRRCERNVTGGGDSAYIIQRRSVALAPVIADLGYCIHARHKFMTEYTPCGCECVPWEASTAMRRALQPFPSSESISFLQAVDDCAATCVKQGTFFRMEEEAGSYQCICAHECSPGPEDDLQLSSPGELCEWQSLRVMVNHTLNR